MSLWFSASAAIPELVARDAVSGQQAFLLTGGRHHRLIYVALVWGVAVIADSAQFPAAIAELSDTLVGTMLTLQTCFGFLLTFVAIQLMPIVSAALGSRYAFAVLAIGPMLGAVAMWRHASPTRP